MVCNLGPSDSMQELDLTGEKKKITREVLPNFDLKNMISIDTREFMEQIDQK
jgi:hypothetical protein